MLLGGFPQMHSFLVWQIREAWKKIFFKKHVGGENAPKLYSILFE